MSEHRRRILDMLAGGKITADEADKLLAALSDADAPAGGAPPPAAGTGKYLRVEIIRPAHDGMREKNVKIRVPASILKSGLKLGSLLRFNDDRWGRWSRLKVGGLDIDSSQFDAAQLDTLLSQVGDVSIDVDDGKAQIRVVRE